MREIAWECSAVFYLFMRFNLNGRRWTLLREPIRRKTAQYDRIYGECSAPTAKHRFVRVDSRIKGELELDALLHELLHAAGWEVLDEEFVETTATGIARLLWRLGYRKTEP